MHKILKSSFIFYCFSQQPNRGLVFFCFVFLRLTLLLFVLCDGKTGLWGWQCKSSMIAKENCVLKCLSPACYELVYESDPVRQCRPPYISLFNCLKLYCASLLFDLKIYVRCVVFSVGRRRERFHQEPRVQVLYAQVTNSFNHLMLYGFSFIPKINYFSYCSVMLRSF